MRGGTPRTLPTRPVPPPIAPLRLPSLRIAFLRITSLRFSSLRIHSWQSACILWAALSGALLLSACGFTPMYGEGAGAPAATTTTTAATTAAAAGQSVPARLNMVEIDLIPDQSGVYLRNILIDHFYQDGYPAAPTHRLTISPVQETRSDLDITQDSEATRRQIRLAATLTLSDLQSGAVVLTRGLTAISSSNVLGTQFTTRVSENDAREAALADLARQIEMQVALYFSR